MSGRPATAHELRISERETQMVRAMSDTRDTLEAAVRYMASETKPYAIEALKTYAVNVCDLSALPASPAFHPTALLLQDFIQQPGTTVQTNRSTVDSGAVVLDGPAAADDARVTALIALLQHVIGPRKLGRRIRCYQRGARGGWTEIIAPDRSTHVARYERGA